jgi:hypothetical protein
MKVSQLLGLAASVLCFAGALPAQNPLVPGELAKEPTFAKSSFSPNLAASSLAPKHETDYVETPHEKHIRILWMASIAAMTAATASDAYSSWHKRESNGLLASSDGSFGAKGVAIKASIGGAVLIPQIIFHKHRDWHMAFALSNFAEAGIFAGAAAHNLSVK